MWHSRGLSHREFLPASSELLDRFRIGLADLPLHGDSEESREFSYTADWVAGLLAEASREIGGPRPRVAASGLGAQLVLRAIGNGQLDPSALVLLPSRLHRPARNRATGTVARGVARVSAPASGLFSRGLVRATVSAELVGSGVTPRVAALDRMSRRSLLESRDRGEGWRRAIAEWDGERFRDLIDVYNRVDCPTLVLWCPDHELAPLQAAEEAADLINGALLRTLPGTGPLLAYDDPVGFAREIASFLRAPDRKSVVRERG